MNGWSSGNNAVLIDQCKPLGDVTVTLLVTKDLVTVDDAGFSLQLNAYPMPGVTSIGIGLNWIQFTLYVSNTYGPNTGAFQWQAWALGATSWPPGYSVPPGSTNPNQPVPPFTQPNAIFASVPSNQLPKGSSLSIELKTDPKSHGVTAATFIVQLVGAAPQSVTVPFPAANPNAQFPIGGFQVDLVGPGNLSNAKFTSGEGEITYSVPSGSSLSVQNGGVGSGCGQYAGAITGESSNVVYGELGSSPSTQITQTFGVPFWLVGDPATLFANNQQHAFSRGTDNGIYQVFYDQGSGHRTGPEQWASNAAGDPATLFANNQQHVFYRGTDNGIYQVFYDQGSGHRTGPEQWI
jgi:hypothetical protein